jgi:hypothetical protein
MHETLDEEERASKLLGQRLTAELDRLERQEANGASLVLRSAIRVPGGGRS